MIPTRQRFVLITSSTIAVLSLMSFVIILSGTKINIRTWMSEHWPKPDRAIATIETTANTSALAFQTVQPDGMPGRMYVFNNHRVSSYEPVSKDSVALSTFPDEVTSVTVSPNLDLYAYLSTVDNKDTLIFRHVGSGGDAVIYTADHSFTGKQETKSLRLQAPIRFSPDGRYAIVRQYSWEGCEDLVVDVAAKKVTATLTCDALSWSTDSRTIAIGNGLGYDGPIQFSYGMPGDIGHLNQVQWREVGGDNTDFLDAEHQTRWANAVPSFVDDDSILLMITWTGDTDAAHQGSVLYQYSMKEKSIHKVASFTHWQFTGQVVVSGHQALLIGADKVYLVDVATKTSKEVTGGIDKNAASFNQYFLYTTPHVVIASMDTNAQGGIVNSRLELLQVDDRTVSTVFDSSDMQFAGWSPVEQPSRDLKFLRQDYSFSDLTAQQVATLDTQIEKMALYKKDLTEKLGGLDCGTTARHDQLQALNDAAIGSSMLNNGLKVTVTPNIYQWNNVDMQQWLADSGDEVVCGVATTTPRFIKNHKIYWWKGCVGGAGIGQPGDPYFDQSIRCVQAEDVIQRYFGMQ